MPTSSEHRNDTTTTSTSHPAYGAAIAAVERSREAKARGDTRAERRALRRARLLTDTILADLRGRLS